MWWEDNDAFLFKIVPSNKMNYHSFRLNIVIRLSFGNQLWGLKQLLHNLINTSAHITSKLYFVWFILNFKLYNVWYNFRIFVIISTAIINMPII